MRLNYFIPVIALTLISFGCVEKEASLSTEPEEIAIDTLYKFMDFDSHGISRPGSLTLLPNANIAVADGQIKKITIVTPDGKLVAQFGEEGRGPAEFIRPGQLTVKSGFLNVVDASQYKVLEYDFEGNYMNNFGYESRAIGGNMALSHNREYYTGAAGENDHLIKWSRAGSDSSFLFGEAKISRVEDMDMEASRVDIMNGRVPDYFKNNVLLALGENHLYAFLNSYSELRKYDLNGNLVWETELALPDNEQLKKDIADAAKNAPNFLPFLTYIYSVKVVESNLYLMGSKTRDSPQHLTKVNQDGQITAFYQMPDAEMNIIDFAINPENQTIYLSNARDGIVYKGSLNN